MERRIKNLLEKATEFLDSSKTSIEARVYAILEIKLGLKEFSDQEIHDILVKADNGDEDCEILAGVMHAVGSHVAKDMSIAYKYWENVSNSNTELAKLLLGENYLKQKRLSQKYLREAKIGNVDAIFHVGLMYEQGSFMPHDLTKAVEYFQKAADLGSADAQISLANMYFSGEGTVVPKNKALAYKYYKSALNSELIGITPQELIAHVNFLLGIAYFEKEKESEVSYDEAIAFFKKAFELNKLDTLYKVAQYHELLKKDDKEWVYKTSLENSMETECILSLGYCFEVGCGTYQDHKLAIKFYKQAAKLDNYQAIHRLSLMYAKGIGIKANPSKAFKLELLAAESGIHEAIDNIVQYYLTGMGVKINKTKAMFWMERSAESKFLEG